MKFWGIIAVFATLCAVGPGCDSPSKPANPLAPSADAPAPEKEIVWELNDQEGGIHLKGTRVRVHRSNIETVITMTGGTTLVTLRNRGDMKQVWTGEDRATVEVAQPGLHCFSTPGDRTSTRPATFEVQFAAEDLSYGTFEGDIPCFKGPKRLKFKGLFQETKQ